jgi:deoxyribose-phosphate aldolase
MLLIYSFFLKKKMDFGCSELVPASARSSTSAAAPLPTQFVPLLGDSLEKVKQMVDRVLPLGKKRTALEEAEYEDDDEEGALEREMLMQGEFVLTVHIAWSLAQPLSF